MTDVNDTHEADANNDEHTFKVGDHVQWVSDGMVQFSEGPREILRLETDPDSGEEFAFFEGLETGIPVSQLAMKPLKKDLTADETEVKAETEEAHDTPKPSKTRPNFNIAGSLVGAAAIAVGSAWAGARYLPGIAPGTSTDSRITALTESHRNAMEAKDTAHENALRAQQDQHDQALQAAQNNIAQQVAAQTAAQTTKIADQEAEIADLTQQLNVALGNLTLSNPDNTPFLGRNPVTADVTYQAPMGYFRGMSQQEIVAALVKAAKAKPDGNRMQTAVEPGQSAWKSSLGVRIPYDDLQQMVNEPGQRGLKAYAEAIDQATRNYVATLTPGQVTRGIDFMFNRERDPNTGAVNITMRPDFDQDGGRDSDGPTGPDMSEIYRIDMP